MTEADPKLYDLDIEAALLGTLLADNSVFPTVSEILQPEDFFEGLHARLYERAGELISTGKRADVLILNRAFADDETLKELRGKQYLAHLAASVMPGTVMRQYAEDIAALAERRRLLDCAAEIRDMASNGRFNGAGAFASAIEILRSRGGAKAKALGSSLLGEWDAGDEWDGDGEFRSIPPRGWLLGSIFCRGNVSSLLGAGGTGKTALRYAQYLSLVIGRSLTGEHVFVRGRVLIVSLEDGIDELRRRIRAVMIHHKITRAEVASRLFLAAPEGKAGKLMVTDDRRRPIAGGLADTLRRVVITRKIDLVALDPFVKTHSVEENSNSAIDDVMNILSTMASERGIAIDIPHHISKGSADPGNPDKGRGASAAKDAARLVYSLAPMSVDEARAFGLTENERRHLVRMDSAKVNIAPPMDEARWFRLVSVDLGNATELYPSGDSVQTVEPWTPPDIWAGLSNHLLNIILDDIDAGLSDGNFYSDSGPATDRAAWRVIINHSPNKSESQARQIIKAWVKSGLLFKDEYDHPTRREKAKGLRVDNSKRPS